MRTTKRVTSLSFVVCMLVAVLLTAAPVSVSAKTKEIVETSRQVYLYDESGAKTLVSSSRDTFNKKGLLKKNVSVYDDEKYVTTYKYDKSGNNTSYIETINGINNTKCTSKYKKGDATKDTFYIWDAEAGKWVKDYYNTYKTTSKKYTIKYYNAKKVLKSTRVEKLDTKGNVTSWKEYDTKKRILFKGSYKYNKKGDITKEVYVCYEGSNPYTETSTYKYNKKGLTTSCKSHTVYADGTVDNTTFTYQYSNYYKKKKDCPQRELKYENGVLSEESIIGYKTISY